MDSQIDGLMDKVINKWTYKKKEWENARHYSKIKRLRNRQIHSQTERQTLTQTDRK